MRFYGTKSRNARLGTVTEIVGKLSSTHKKNQIGKYVYTVQRDRVNIRDVTIPDTKYVKPSLYFITSIITAQRSLTSFYKFF